MPLYEYSCLDCQSEFEVLRPISEADAPIACEHCHSQHTSRRLSLFFAQSGGHVLRGASGGSCSSCSGGSCSTCGI
jgi:putative FmdB family regulatory protein